MRWVNEPIKNYNIILWIPFLLFTFIFHNKATLLSLFQMAFFSPRCLWSPVFFFFAFSYKPKPSSGSWCRFSPGGCLHPTLEPADHPDCNPPGMGVTDVNPRLSDSLAVLESLSSLARPSICLSGRTPFILRGNGRVSTFVRQSKIVCSNG